MPKFRRVRSLISRPFCCPMIATVCPRSGQPRHERRILGASAVAVQLDEVLEQALDVIERVRAL